MQPKTVHREYVTDMNPKFMYLYLIGGTLALILLIYQLATTYPAISTGGLIFNFIPVLVLYYLAYKTYHVKKDDELM